MKILVYAWVPSSEIDFVLKRYGWAHNRVFEGELMDVAQCLLDNGLNVMFLSSPQENKESQENRENSTRIIYVDTKRFQQR